MSQDENILVEESMRKDENTKIKAKVNEYGGRYNFDLRIWMDTEKYRGPTKKGVFVNLSLAPEMMKMMQKVLKKGWKEVQEREAVDHLSEIGKPREEQKDRDIRKLQRKYER